MVPIRRDFRFTLSPKKLSNWHREGTSVSHFFNALSVFFPVGERFFISSVRNYRERISDPELRKAIVAFIGQEAMHGREHESYNELLEAGGLPAEGLEQFVKKVLGTVQKLTPESFQLSVTIALEHFTAILADRLLADPRMLEGGDAEFKRLWLWHALEETEHKAVAFDVWHQAMGDDAKAYALRCGGMLAAGAAFVALVTAFSIVLIEHDAGKRPDSSGRVPEYRALARFLLGRGGLMRTGFPEWLKYFRRDFHPWQHDNRDLLNRIDEISAVPDARPTLAHAA